MLDLSDNEVRKLEGIPASKRLSTLLLSNNRVYKLGSDLGTTLPNLHTVVLNNNLVCRRVRACAPMQRSC